MATTPQLHQQIAPDVKLGQRVRIFGFTNLYGCQIGDDVKIGTFVEIQKGARVGNNCKISSHTFICEGVVLEDEVPLRLTPTREAETLVKLTAGEMARVERERGGRDGLELDRHSSSLGRSRRLPVPSPGIGTIT